MELRASELDPKKILIVLHGSIGDVTRALPLARLLRRGFPKAYLAWSVEMAAHPLLLANPSVDEVIVFDRSRWWKSFWPFLAKIRAARFDLVLDLQRHLKSGIVSRITGAPYRLGFHPADSKEGNGFFNNLHIERYGDAISKIEHYLKFADYLGIARAPIEWSFELTPIEEVAVEKHLAPIRGPFATLFVGTRWQSKQWFPRQIAECASLLQSVYEMNVVLLGGHDDQALAQEAMANSNERALNLVGHTSLREAVGIIQRAKIAVGPDTGLMHIAAAVGTPVISLWGATDPARTGPYGFGELVIRGQAPCSPCYKKNCPIGRVCMQSISRAEIAEKIGVALRHEGASHIGYGDVG
jgi:lipopolysaccharide heptosyltransferase II